MSRLGLLGIVLPIKREEREKNLHRLGEMVMSRLGLLGIVLPIKREEREKNDSFIQLFICMCGEK